MKSHFLKNLSFAFFVVFLFFGVLEVRARIRHPQVGFREMTNSLGFRSLEFNPKKETSTKRILFIGSSTTFGVEGPVEKTFPYLVGKILKTQPHLGHVETLNAAWPGETSYWEIQRMKNTLWLDPDVIVVMTGYNDSATVYNHFARISERGDLMITPWVFRLDSFISTHSVFYVTLREKLAILLYGDPRLAFVRRNNFSEKKQDHPEWFEFYPQHFRKNLEEMVQITKGHHIKLVFIKAPLSIQRRSEHPLYSRAYFRLMEELEGVSREQGVGLIDLEDAFSVPAAQDYIGRDGLHFPDAGNAAIAQEVSRFFFTHSSDYF